MEWTDEISLALIELYRNHSVLWDPKHTKYNNKNRKEDAWTEIGKGMDLPAVICKNKMKVLLSGYRREKSRHNKSRRRGKGSSEIYQSQWFAFDSFSFLLDRDKPRKTLNTGYDDTPESVEQRADTSPTPTQSTENELPPLTNVAEQIETPPPAKPKFDPKLAMLKDALGMLKSMSTKSAEDDISSFCKFLDHKLRSYDHRTKNFVQQELAEVIFKADSGYFTQNTSYCPP